MFSPATALVRSGFGAVTAAAVLVRAVLNQSDNTWVPPEPSGDGRPRAQITNRGVPLHQARAKRAA